MPSKYRYRFLPTVALIAAALLLFSACSFFGSSSDDETQIQPAQTTEPETQIQFDTIESDTTEPETTAPIVDRTGEEIYQAHSELTPVNYDSPALLPITEDAGQNYIDNITFLCDSPFYWLKLYGMLSDGYDTTQIWTGDEGTMTLGYLDGFPILDPIDNVMRTIPEAVAEHKPPMIVITVGINGVALWDEPKFKEEYVKLIDWIKTSSPDTQIIAQSIMPISPAYANWGLITNATITAANAWILEVAEECDIHYLDTFSVLVGEDGNIRPELVQGDGLHANEDGLDLALEYIRTHAYITETDAGD